MSLLKLRYKTLIVSAWAPPSVAGGPVMLYNIFSHFDPSCYALYTSPKNIEQSALVQGQKLPCAYFFFENGQSFNKEQILDNTAIRKNNKNKLIKLFKKIGAAYYTISNGLKIIKEQKIDLLFGTSDVGKTLTLTYILSLISGKPYVLHMFDYYKGNSFPPFFKWWASIFEPILFRGAKKIFVFNLCIALDLKQKYPKLSFQAVENNESAQEYLKYRSAYNPKPPYTILYTGNIYWAQESSLINMIKAVQTIDLPVQLIIYSPKKHPHFEQNYGSDRVKFAFAKPEEMPSIQSKAHILFIPLSWRSGMIGDIVIKTATPGKLPGYLMSGRPIIVHAPADCYLSQYAQAEGYAEVVDTQDIYALQNAIKKLLTDVTYVQKLIANAERTFYAHHESNSVASFVRTELNAIQQTIEQTIQKSKK